jgi:uncharacterized membrane protein YdjX (TVP38/TMEM64 family)
MNAQYNISNVKGEPVNSRRSALFFWIALGAIILLLTFLLYSPTFRNFVDEATIWAEVRMRAHPLTGAAVFFFFAAGSAMLAFTSSVVLVPAANLVWGKLITFLLLWGGWIAGAIAAFGIGNVARPLLIRLGYQETLQHYQQFISKRMKFWAVLLFCFAVPSEVPGYLFGGLHYPFWKFLAAIAIVEAIYAFGIVIAGENLVADKPFSLLAVVAILIIIGIAARSLLSKLKKRKAETPSR